MADRDRWTESTLTIARLTSNDPLFKNEIYYSGTDNVWCRISSSSYQLYAVTSSVSSVSVAGVDLPVAEEMKVLGVVLD